MYAVAATTPPIPCPEVPGRMITASPMAVSITLGFESEIISTINLNYIQLGRHRRNHHARGAGACWCWGRASDDGRGCGAAGP